MRNMHYRTSNKFHKDRSNSCRGFTFNVFQMLAICHLGFVGQIFRQPIKDLVVYTTVHNLVGITSVFLIIRSFHTL